MYEGDPMKSRATRFSIRFTALAALGIGLAACAQVGGEPPVETEQPSEAVQAGDPAAAAPAVARRAHQMRRDPQKMIEKFDANNNGTLELSELPGHKREFLEQADTDKDGSLSLAELEAAHRDGKLKAFRGKRDGHGRHGFMAKSPQKMIEKFDANKNGTLELAELPEHKRDRLAAADTDKNGSLSVAELEAHKQKMGERMFAMRDENKDGFLTESEVGKRHWSKLSIADADQDGKVSKAEIEAAHRDGKLGFRKHGRTSNQAQ
jgi:Ca2+-binding EF-hand superfamily protein